MRGEPADLDRAIEGGQHHIGLARDREMLFVALDVLVQVGADDIDAAGSDEQPRERRRQCKTLDQANGQNHGEILRPG